MEKSKVKELAYNAGFESHESYYQGQPEYDEITLEMLNKFADEIQEYLNLDFAKILEVHFKSTDAIKSMNQLVRKPITPRPGPPQDSIKQQECICCNDKDKLIRELTRQREAAENNLATFLEEEVKAAPKKLEYGALLCNGCKNRMDIVCDHIAQDSEIDDE